MKNRLFFFLFLSFVLSCKSESDERKDIQELSNEGKGELEEINFIEELPEGIVTPEGMVWIPGGKFVQGAIEDDTMALAHEKPSSHSCCRWIFYGSDRSNQWSVQKIR
ncbi:hypothetical protein [Antarcticibacterium sp. 1MA-6-2]|uniref:hypothetical protein n=1 Tax=Antarcticibacterium sp. 1MA-6-2 TaxID=2908210 RepID=UPI002882F679|nr:hypothetical protein [Antarcticibacterium sp. 1MA-6-2]